ncbi:MAG: ABC transporter permease [Agriterribacter sp.]
MFKNYLVIALRAFVKSKALTGINILGLSIGISASLVIYLLAHYHFSFNESEKDKERIYRVVSNFNFSGAVYHNSGVHDPMGAAVKKELTGLDAVVNLRLWNGQPKISVSATGSKNKAVFKRQKDFVFADSNYFNMVGYEWLAGSPTTSFKHPYQIVLTESYAQLYFPQLAPGEIRGKEIMLDDTIRATVSGVVKDLSRLTDFTFKAFMSYVTLETTSLKPDNWEQWSSTNGSQQLYVKLVKSNSVARVEQQIAALYNRHHTKEPGDNSKTWHTLQPLSDIHFNHDYGNYNAPMGHKPTLYGLMAIAAFLLLLGCINFINLTTAYASQRAKEIGIRKTLGSSKKQLVAQFLGETFLLTLTATLLSILLTPLLLKAFSGFIPEGLRFSLTEYPGILLFLLALLVVVTILSGFYPAVVLAGYRPVLVLKNQVYSAAGSNRNAWLRKSLTVSQFTIAQVFIMAALLVSKQITYSLNKELGFKKEAILFSHTYFDTSKTNKFVLANKLRSIPEVSMVSLSSNPPSTNNTWSGTVKYKDGKKEIETDVQQKYGDTNYIKLYGLKLLAGHNIAQTDTVMSFLINETYARILGFTNPQDAIGQYLEWSNKQIPVTGVVADFHQKSLREPIKPLVIANWLNVEHCVNILLAPQQPGANNWSSAIKKIEKNWKEIYPDADFEYSFFDKDIEKYYQEEQNISNLLKWGTGLAIFISCLGLLGLVIYSTTQRTKEIGVRKVLGASVANIVAIVSKEFVVLVLLAFLIAVPLAWLAMHKWLENFAYRTEISYWIFVSAGLFMIVIALLTLSIQTIKAALANPVKSLRTE